MRRINAQALERLKFYEQGPGGGPALKAYRCPAGKWTIGYGETGPDIGPLTTMRADEAEPSLLRRLVEFEQLVEQACTVPPSDNQFSAMVLLAYNIGPGWRGTKKPPGAKDGFRQSSVLRLHNQRRFADAAASFVLWNKGTNDKGAFGPLRGLTIRRNWEAALYLKPTESELVLDPPRTRAADVEPSPAPDDSGGTRKIVTGAAAVGAAATAASQVVAQVEPVWTGLQRAAGPNTPHVIMALIGLVAVLAICATVYLVARQRRAG